MARTKQTARKQPGNQIATAPQQPREEEKVAVVPKPIKKIDWTPNPARKRQLRQTIETMEDDLDFPVKEGMLEKYDYLIEKISENFDLYFDLDLELKKLGCGAEDEPHFKDFVGIYLFLNAKDEPPFLEFLVTKNILYDVSKMIDYYMNDGFKDATRYADCLYFS